MQGIFLITVITALYIIYPKASVNISGNIIKFERGNANLIIISENPDFSNARYFEINNSIIRLKPGKYYWKASNNYLEGMANELIIPSEVGLNLENSSLENTGNVEINVTQENEEGEKELVILGIQAEYPVNDTNKTVYEGGQYGQ